MFNPWLILAVILAFAGSNAASYNFGHGNGVNKQKIADQAQFDKINDDLAKQKRDAAAELKLANQKVIDELVNRDKFKNQLGEEREKNRQITHKLSDVYAAYGLRFELTETPRCWVGGRYTQGAECDAALNAKAAVKQSFSFQKRLQQIFDNSLTMPKTGSTNTGSATPTPIQNR